jgi:hypothetical protein
VSLANNTAERCQKNLNSIELLRTLGYDFLSAVALLERLLHQYQSQRGK